MTLGSAAAVLAAFSVVGRKTSTGAAGAAGDADDGDLKMVRGAALAFALALAGGGGDGGGPPEEDEVMTGGSLGYLTVEAEDVLGAALAWALALGAVLGLTWGGSPLG